MKELLLIGFFLLTAPFMQGQIIRVPADYAKIQDGINAAAPGDTILVADGIYYERVNFMGKKPLLVTSEYLLDGDEKHISHTVIDGSLFPYTSRSIVYFILGEDSSSVLCGFTIKNGGGTIYHSGNKTFKAGGGIFISNSGAKIINNHITQNHLNYNPLDDNIDIFDGAAIATEYKADENWVVIENNVIDQNTCISANVQAKGSGICIYCNSRIAGNNIADNVCTGLKASSAVAAGIACLVEPEWGIAVTAIITGNIIANNLTQARYGYAAGSGLYLQHVSGIVKNNIVERNELITRSVNGGSAGLEFQLPLEGSMISGNMFTGNNCNSRSGALTIETTEQHVLQSRILLDGNYFFFNRAKNGGAVTIVNVPAAFQNNVLSGNNAHSYGGGMFLWQDIELPVHHMIKLVNNSFYDNTAEYGGAVYAHKCKPLVFNSIFSHDAALMGPEFYLSYVYDTLEIAYSNIDFTQVWGMINNGGHNNYANPMYKDQVLLTLGWDSPCIDSGTEFFTCDCGVLHSCPDYDVDGVPRTDGPVDIGAHELYLVTGLQGRGDTGDEYFALLKVYPNPASETATFEYNLTLPCHIRLDVYDFCGRRVITLADEHQPAGQHRVMWDTKNCMSGIYFYRLSADQQSFKGKLVVNR